MSQLSTVLHLTMLSFGAMPVNNEVADRVLSVGTILRASGELTRAADVDAENPLRICRWMLIVNQVEGDNRRLLWAMNDVHGQPRTPWTKRFGELSIGPDLTARDEKGGPFFEAAIDGHIQQFTVGLPFFSHHTKLAVGANFQADGTRYTVAGRENISSFSAWRVEFTKQGQSRTLWVESGSPLVVQSVERRLLGRQVPHNFTLRVDRVGTLTADEIAGRKAAIADLAKLRDHIEEMPRTEMSSVALRKHLKAAKELVLKFEKLEKVPVLESIARAAVLELEESVRRAQALEELAQKAVGRMAPEFKLPGLQGKTISLADFKGRPVVLHFFEYTSEPLTAPYGEVGYLETIWQQRKNQAVQVVGIAVDRRLRFARTREQAQEDVREFCKFMNPSYPVVFDEADTIFKYGDPRDLSASLPLYVVLASDGKIATYHIGPWVESPGSGLKNLDGILNRLLSPSKP